MSDSHPLVYGIDVHARCLTNIPAEENKTLFLVGTYTLKEEGQVSQKHPENYFLAQIS